MISSDALKIGRRDHRRGALNRFDEHLANRLWIIYIGPSSGSRLFKQTPHIALRMHRTENWLATAEIVVELGCDIDPIVRYEQKVVGLPDCCQGLHLWDKALQLYCLAQREQEFPIGRALNVPDETYQEAGPHLLRQSEDGFDEGSWRS